MKRNKDHSKVIARISRQDILPLLRGMFVSPESAGRVKRSAVREPYHNDNSDDGLILTARECSYLGG